MSNTILESGWRSDLVDAHRTTIERIAQPGTWWTGAERIAIAADHRRALAHAALPPWEAPSGLDWLDLGEVLPPAAVDAVWRLTNHPGTLTEAWFRSIIGGLPSPEHYVELVGIVAAMNSLDRFAVAMGLDLLPLPEPVGGEPSRTPADGATVSTHWVPTVGARGANVQRALSAVPGALAMVLTLSEAQYVPADALMGDLSWSRGPLDRRQVELVAAATSLVNECFY